MCGLAVSTLRHADASQGCAVGERVRKVLEEFALFRNPSLSRLAFAAFIDHTVFMGL
jgi:hypothetical protein